MSLPSTSSLMKIIEPAVKLLGYELVACEIVPQGRRVLLRVYIDAPEGVTIRDCELASRQIGAVLDVEDPILGGYFLEVSSPGSDRFLITEQHFKRFLGHRIRVKSRSARNGRSNYSGQLQSVEDGNITMVVDGDTYVIAISDIEKAKLVPDN